MSKNIYIVSDLHLGAPDYQASLEREKLFVNWLEEIEPKTEVIYLVGDIFDFWFEYRKTVPQGFIRILGKLAMMADKGIKIHLFTGNHDLWYRDYLKREIGAAIHVEPYTVSHFGKKIYLAHGDGLGPGDYGYKFIKSIFVNPVCQWLFRRLHPDSGVGLANFFSKLSGKRSKTGNIPKFEEEKDNLVIHSRNIMSNDTDYHYFIYGHKHILKTYSLAPETDIIFLGDWLNYNSYVELSEKGIKVLHFEKKVC